MSDSNRTDVIGNIEGSYESTSRVYDPNAISPALNCCEGGDRQPKIIESFYESREPRVYSEVAPTLRSERTGLDVVEEMPISTNGTEIAGTIRATYYKNGERNIIENLENGMGYEGVIEPQVMTPKRTEHGKAIRKEYESHQVYEHRADMTTLEPRDDGLSNTLTTVTKDNYVLEPQIVGCRGRNPDDPSDRTAGSPTEQRLELNSESISNCLTSVSKDNYVLEPDDAPEVVRVKQATKRGYIECEVGGVADISYPDSEFRRGRVQSGGNISPTITCSSEIVRIEDQKDSPTQVHYRIRKLTPRETWRLMGFSDEAFDRASAVNSKTQLYRQSGNSIVKNVLVAIFGQMFEGKENVYCDYSPKS